MTPPPLFLRQVVVEAAGEGEQKRDGVAGKMLVVADVDVGNDDATFDQLVVKPCTAEAGSGGANPAHGSIGCSLRCTKPRLSSSPRRWCAGIGAGSVCIGVGSRAVVSAGPRSRPPSAI